MSNSLAGNPRPGGGPTRQQLDELDALLQRMLDLPVRQGDEADEPAEPVAPPRASAAPRTARPIPAPEPDLPPVRYYEPEYHEDEEDVPPPPPAPSPPRVAYLEPPVPGGRHDLEEDAPVDPTEELARIRAAMQQKADRQAEQAGQSALPPTANIPNAPDVGQGEWVPLRSSWQPSAQTWKPLADRWEQSSRPADPAPAPSVVIAAPQRPQAPVFPPRHTPSGPVILTQTAPESQPIVPPPPRPAQPQPAAAQPPKPAPAAQEPQAPSIPWPLLPLVWFNAVFDVLLLPWCPKGKLLRGPTGRRLLGVLGVLCLLAAAALAFADGFGWIW